MKIIKSEKYIKSQNQTAQEIQDAFSGFGNKMDQQRQKRYVDYANQVIKLINQGIPQQQAFDQVVGNPGQAFRAGVVEAIKSIWNQQTPQTPGKSYDDAYPDNPMDQQPIPVRS